MARMVRMIKEEGVHLNMTDSDRVSFDNVDIDNNDVNDNVDNGEDDQGVRRPPQCDGQ